MDKDTKKQSIRVVICFALIIFGFFSCIVRIAVISTGNYSKVAATQSQKRIVIGNLRGTIFDCNKIPITNGNKKILAAVIPSPYSVMNLKSAVSTEKLDTVNDLLSNKEPFIIEVNEKIDSDTIASTVYYEDTDEKPYCAHLIGYTDSQGHGVSGLQKAYDELLYSDKKVSAVFKTNGRGEVLKGEGIKIENDTSVIANGLVTTIDINIQTKIEKIADKIKKGAIVVADSKTAKIRAMVSRPDFDTKNVAKYLNAENSPLVNRALSAYNVGSAFKPCVAAAAIENNRYDTVFCKGYLEIEDRRFNCHERLGHKALSLVGGLKNSCNVFFYSTAINLGYKAIYSTATSLNFGNKIKLCENLYTKDGNLPTLDEVKTKSSLANLSIGQGELLLSPVSMLPLYCAIAGDGTYILPSVVEGCFKNGIYTAQESSPPTRVMNSNTAKTLREYLKEVVEDGTGKSAKPKNTTAAGKTATAQTGKYENNREITHSWFCGFFPADTPRYVVIVMVEDAAGSANIFAEIADSIN